MEVKLKIQKYGCLITYLLMHLIVGISITWWTQSNLMWTLLQTRGHHVDVPLWVSALISIAASEIILPMNILFSFIRLF